MDESKRPVERAERNAQRGGGVSERQSSKTGFFIDSSLLALSFSLGVLGIFDLEAAAHSSLGPRTSCIGSSEPFETTSAATNFVYLGSIHDELQMPKTSQRFP